MRKKARVVDFKINLDVQNIFLNTGVDWLVVIVMLVISFLIYFTLSVYDV